MCIAYWNIHCQGKKQINERHCDSEIKLLTVNILNTLSPINLNNWKMDPRTSLLKSLRNKGGNQLTPKYFKYSKQSYVLVIIFLLDYLNICTARATSPSFAFSDDILLLWTLRWQYLQVFCSLQLSWEWCRKIREQFTVLVQRLFRNILRFI